MNAGNRNIILFVVLAATAHGAFAEPAPGIVREANKLYRQQQFKDALDGYERALTESPQAIEPQFNKAAAYFRLDDLQQAIDLYRTVAAESKDMQLVAAAKYNLGNCFFRQGAKQADSDLQRAVENMLTAIAWWRQALDIDPTNENAARNIEVARLTIKDIVDQLNKQRQHQEQQAQQQKQLQEDLQKLLEEQKGLADKTQTTRQQADNNDISQDQAAQAYSDIARQQSDLADRTEQTAAKMQQQIDPNMPDERMQKAAGQLGDAVDKQKDAAKKLDAAEAAGGKKSQDEATADIEEALKALSEEQEQNRQENQQPGEQQDTQQQAAQEPNQPQEADQPQQTAAPDTSAEEILDREQQQKERRQLMQSPGFQKVDKDW